MYISCCPAAKVPKFFELRYMYVLNGPSSNFAPAVLWFSVKFLEALEMPGRALQELPAFDMCRPAAEACAGANKRLGGLCTKVLAIP